MNNIYLLKSKRISCELEFDFIKHTYQDACCLHFIKDDEKKEYLSESKILKDFIDFMHMDYDFETPKKLEDYTVYDKQKYMDKKNIIDEYIDKNDNPDFEIIVRKK